MTDNHGYLISPCPVAPVNETDMILRPEGLKALKRGAKTVGLDLGGAHLNLDAGFDSTHNRTCIFNAGMIPNIQENPRPRKRGKRGRKRWFNAAIHALRTQVDRTFAWEDTFKRLLLRFEHIQQRHFGMKRMAYTWIHVREFCGAQNSQPMHLNLDGGFDSTSNRKAIFNTGMIPHIKENPRQRKSPKRGRKQLFNEAIQA